MHLHDVAQAPSTGSAASVAGTRKVGGARVAARSVAQPAFEGALPELLSRARRLVASAPEVRLSLIKAVARRVGAGWAPDSARVADAILAGG